MPKINVYLPDELAEAVREAGVPVSAICQRALEQAVRRITAIRQTALTDLELGDLTTRLPHFTGRANAVIKLAIDEARAAGSPNVGTWHILSGILAEGNNLALRVLPAMEVDPDAVRHAMAKQPSTEPGGSADTTSQHFSGAAANAMELAVSEATAFGHNYVGCEHLLLGLAIEPDGVAGQVLRSLGVEPRLTRRAVTAALAGYVHLRAQTAGTPAAPTTDVPAMLAPALRTELQPLMSRIERLEQHVGMPSEE